MARNTPTQILFPRLGVMRRFTVRPETRQAEFGTPWAMNVRLEDSLTKRLRGGSFTGQSASTVGDPQYFDLQTEASVNIITEAGNEIQLGPEYGVASGDGRLWVEVGEDAPTRGTADCLYRDRLFRVSSNAIYVSAQGDTEDWNYGADLENTGRACVFQLSEAGEVGDAVVALVPHKDATLLCFTAAETWVLHGDPTTGTLRNVSRDVGIIAARAWCKNHDTVYFLSSRGLYAVGADGSGLKALSEDKLPEHLIGVSDANAIMDYYHADRGVYIHLTASPSWFYDTARDQFWPFDTTVTDSHVLLGPISLGQENSYGRILNLQGNMATGSGDVTWHIVTGDTAEEAAANGKAAITLAVANADYSDYVAASGTWSAGRSHMAYPRVRALWCCIWLAAESAWAYEAVALTRQPSGRWK